MRPFGCLVTILNTLDPLEKFDGKADEGFSVVYSINSKAFRVFNSRTRIVQETLHINFLENQSNVAGNGPKWLFDIDTLTQSMNYQSVVAGNQPNNSACIQENINTGKVRKETILIQQYVLPPFWSTGPKDPQNTDANAAKENENEVHVSPSSSDKPKKHDEKDKKEAKGKSPVDLSTGVRDLTDEFEEFSVHNSNKVNAASAPVTAVGPNPTNNTNSFNAASPSDNVETDTQEKDKNKAKNDKTKHEMKKIEKDKVIQSPRSTKVNPGKVKVNPEKVKFKPGKAEAEKAGKIQFKGLKLSSP
nr:ribonuclease H-like domain-containing protein [Tanacetum cinerariifolium]